MAKVSKSKAPPYTIMVYIMNPSLAKAIAITDEISNSTLIRHQSYIIEFLSITDSG